VLMSYVTEQRHLTDAIIYRSVTDFRGITLSKDLMRKKVPITFADHFGSGRIRGSKYLRISPHPDGLIELSAYAAGLERKPVLFVVRDEHLDWISSNSDMLPNLRFQVPPPHTLALNDKANFARFAAEHRFPIPRTVIKLANYEWREIYSELTFPCVVKPTLKGPNYNLAKAYVVHSVEHLKTLEALLNSVPADYVLQEWIDGGDSDIYFALMLCEAGGRVRQSFIGRKIRQWPLGVGYTSAAEPSCQPTVLKIASEIAEAGGFQGLCSVEFKGSSKSGRLLIIEPTIGRPDLQSSIAAANGCDLAYQLYCELSGEAEKWQSSRAQPVKWILVSSDVKAAYASYARGIGTVRSLLRSYRGKKYLVLPTFRLFVIGAISVVRRLYNRRSDSRSHERARLTHLAHRDSFGA